MLMTLKVCYFSGTGNSLSVAKTIACRAGGELLSISAVVCNRGKARNSVLDSSALCVVFPVYHVSLPLIVREFLSNSVSLANRYVAGVCTYGDNPVLAIEQLRKLVEANGGELAAGFGIQLPYNYLTPGFSVTDFLSSFALRYISAEKREALFAAAEAKAIEIGDFVAARKTGVFEMERHLATELAHRFGLKQTFGKWFWFKLAGVQGTERLSFWEGLRRMDTAFRVDENCTGCGVCARICPVRNIRMRDNEPNWQHRCEQCFACLHWCPQEAIQFANNTVGQPRYHHPEVTLEDMLQPHEPSTMESGGDTE
jgi:ferredoxin